MRCRLLFFPIIIFLISSLQSCSQTSSMVHHNKIDSITTAREVELLLSGLNSDFKRFVVNEKMKFDDLKCSKLAASLPVKPFAKADFDGNGYTDLLVTGTYYDPMVICILDSGDNRFFYRRLTRRSFRIARSR